MKLTGNTILITGGSSGFGLELAKAFQLRNNKVLICGRDPEKLHRAKRMLPGLEIIRTDLSSAQECEELVRQVSSAFPGLNVLINNAAIVHKGDFLSDSHTLEKAEAEFNTNLLAPIRLSKLLLPLLLRNASPAIINITTGLVYTPRFCYTYYNSGKAALHVFTQVLRKQLADTAVRVVEILLPVVDTPWHQGRPPATAITAEQAVTLALKPLKKGKQEIRVGKVKLLYLLSRLAPAFALRKLNNLP